MDEIWDLGTQVMLMWYTFDLLVFKVILGSFSALVSKWLGIDVPVTQKVACTMCTAKETEIWDSGTLVQKKMGYLGSSSVSI